MKNQKTVEYTGWSFEELGRKSEGIEVDNNEANGIKRLHLYQIISNLSDIA